jgi:hypothetical protein
VPEASIPILRQVSTVPDLRAKKQMKSSGRFPVVALRSPPILSPNLSEMFEVIDDIPDESGIMDKTEAIKEGVLRFNKYKTMLRGTNIKRYFSFIEKSPPLLNPLYNMR